MSENINDLENVPSDTDTTTELPKPVDASDLPPLEDATDTEDDAEPDRDNVFTKIRRHPAVTAGVGIAIVAVLGIGIAFGMPGKSTSSMAKPAQSAAITQVSAKKTAKQKVTLSIEADGWSDGDGEFGYAVVNKDGQEVAKGEFAPSKGTSVKLAEGAYALNVTSIPTAKDGKTTWIVPEAVDFTVEGKAATVTVKLAKVDMTDDAAVAAAIEKLPESERKAAEKLIEAKRENPNSSAVSTPISKPSAATVKKAESQAAAKPAAGNSSASKPSGSTSKPASSNKSDSKPSKSDGGSSKPSGSSKPAGGNKTDSKPSSGSQSSNKGDSSSSSGNQGSNQGSGSSKPAEPERVWAVVTPAWDEQVYHPAVTHTETTKQKVGVQYRATDGTLFDDEDSCSDYCAENGLWYSCLPKYQDVTTTVVDQAAWTETVHHDAVYGWVNK